MEDRIHGLDPNYIENKEKYQTLIDLMLCPMCLDVVLNPLECKFCNTLLCENCYIILKIAGKQCPTESCKGEFSKANRYVREFLRALYISCEYCQKKEMNYENYISHLTQCKEYLSKPLNVTIKKIHETDEEIKKLQKMTSLDQMSRSSPSINNNLKPSNMGNSNFSNNNISQSMQQPVMNLITSRLNGQQKMELYKCCTEGKRINFANLIEKKGYPILEEISAKNFGWTPLHYAMHYGKLEIVDYILSYLRERGLLESALRLKSSDGRTPILCLLRSSNIDGNLKKQMFVEVCNKFHVEITTEVKYELTGRKMEDILRKLTY